MKCSNCGHEIENGSGFCENCGMILSLDGDSSYNENELMQDVYSSVSFEDDNSEFESYFENEEDENFQDTLQTEEIEMPRELEADETEQIAYVEAYDENGESIANGYNEQEKESEESFLFEDEKEDDNDEADESQEEIESDEEETQETVATYESSNESEDAFEEYEDETSYDEAANEEVQDEQEQDDVYDEDLDDMYIEKGKNRKGTALIATLVVILIAVVAGGVGIIKGDFKLPTIAKPQETTTDVEQSDKDVSNEEETTQIDVTEKETTDKETTESQTEKETTVKETEKETQKTNASTESSSTTQPSTTKPSTTKPSATQPSTTKPSTTKPSTTKPNTTQPSTTKPSTTKPSTTKESETQTSSTTSKYSITDAKVQAPKKYLSSSFTAYMKENGVVLRAKPSSDSERVLYLSYGDDLKVLASENGFYYVRSSRYGVYGWVKQSYVSKTRPEAETTATVVNLVEPDKKYSKVETKYVNTYEGLRLRKGPGTNYDVIRFLSNGYPLKVVGYSSTVSGWVYVTDTTHGVSGWVSSAYIK